MIDENADDPTVVLSEIRQQFIAGFEQQCARLAALAADPDPAARGRAVQTLHRMAGLAGTVGLMRVSAAASRIENALRRDPVAIRFPITDDVAELRAAFADDLVDSAAPEAATAIQTVAPMTVMLVEDDPEQRSIVAAHLRRAGHTPVLVDAGDKAADAARAVQPAIVLLDMHLPGLDGHAVCRRFKADPALATIPIVFLSAASDVNSRLVGLALGADDFLVKPIDPRELLLRLQRLHDRMQHTALVPPVTELDYDAFRRAADGGLQRYGAALALVKTPPSSRSAVLDALRHETRRRDIVGEYDRHHVVVLLPDAGAAAARDRLASIISLLRDRGVQGVSAGIAASPAPGACTLDGLLQEADEALAEARYRDVPVAIRSDTPPAKRRPEQGPTILVADDDPDIVRIVDAHLGAAGYRRVLAFDGAKALEAIHANHPAVMIVDIMMPRLTGFEILAKLRDMGEARPRVVVLSARGREDDVTRAFDLGADDYVIKPFSPQELVARVERLLR